MCCIFRGIFRWGIIAALALGGLTLVLGKDRVAAALSQVRTKVQGVIDSQIDDPVALRRQLQSLADKYPGRIAEVRTELAKVEQQTTQFERDVQVSQRVVAMTTSDLGELKTLVARAETEKSSNVRPVSIRFGSSRMDIDDAYLEAGRINAVRLSYQDRLVSNQQQLTMLGEQKSRLNEILAKLEGEFNTFQAQSWQLDRQIDAIERNNRLIEMTKSLQDTLDGYDRWGKVGNLKQLESKLAELRTVQESQLKTLKAQGLRQNYHEKAQRSFEETQPGVSGHGNVFDGLETPSAGDPSVEAAPSSATGSGRVSASAGAPAAKVEGNADVRHWPLDPIIVQ